MISITYKHAKIPVNAKISPVFLIMITSDSNNDSNARSDFYSYTGRVKFFDREKEFGYILEIEDAGRSDRVVGEWRITAQHLGNVVLKRGDYVYFMKKDGEVVDVTPLHMRDLLRKPCHVCGRRDYVPGRDFFCSHCGKRLPAVAGTT